MEKIPGQAARDFFRNWFGTAPFSISAIQKRQYIFLCLPLYQLPFLILFIRFIFVDESCGASCHAMDFLTFSSSSGVHCVYFTICSSEKESLSIRPIMCS